ncbi:MAG: type II secretion system F family protein [Candidatus Aenigmarchaeota archaeon]|nr:type II secretion system F family protein [Candidatus Aenigmarchaeota archaeon]
MKSYIKYFGKLGIKLLKFKGMQNQLLKAGQDMFLEYYVGRMMFFSLIAFVMSFVYMLIAFLFIGMGLFGILLAFILSIVSAGFVFFLFYIWPTKLIMSRKENVESNMPFVINHMSAIATSGVPPHTMFKLIANTSEYGELAKECGRVVRNMEILGMDVTSAIKEVSSRTPSIALKTFFNGINSTILSGGDLKKYLHDAAKESMNDYRLKREKYISTLATYADFYVGVLIAAPLFFVSVMSLLAVIGGSLFGVSLPLLMAIGIYVIIPMMNVVFILFVHVTQPSV